MLQEALLPRRASDDDLSIADMEGRTSGSDSSDDIFRTLSGPWRSSRRSSFRETTDPPEALVDVGSSNSRSDPVSQNNGNGNARGVRRSCAKLFGCCGGDSSSANMMIRRKRSVGSYSKMIHMRKWSKPVLNKWLKLDGQTLQEIIVFLPIRDVLSMKRVNKKMGSIVGDSALWAKLLNRDFSTELPSKEDNAAIPPRITGSFRPLRRFPHGRFSHTEREPIETFEQTYKHYLMRTNMKRLNAYQAREAVEKRKRQFVCCSILRCIADFEHFLCFPLLLGAFPITTLVLLGVKLNDADSMGWWLVLLPMEMTVALSLVLLVQAAIFYYFPIQERIVEECLNVERESTPCGEFVEGVELTKCPRSPLRGLSVVMFIGSFISVIAFAILLFLKLEIGMDTPWSILLIPLEISIPSMPSSILLSANAHDADEALSITSLTMLLLFLPVVLTILLFGLQVDGLVSLAMWEVFMPILLSLGLCWLMLLIGISVYIRETLNGEYNRREAAGCGLLLGLCSVIVLGMLGAQPIVFILRGDTHLLDSASYLKLFSPGLVIFAIFCTVVWIFSVVIAVDYYKRNTFFTSGNCGYLSEDASGRQEIREQEQLLDIVTLG